MKKFMSKCYDLYDYFCRALILVMVLLVIASVFLRYIFGITFIWAEEGITMLFVASSFYGAFLCLAEGEHIQIDFLYQKFSPKLKNIMDIVIYCVIFFVEFYMTKLSLFWIKKVGDVLTNGMRLPIKLFYSMIPISCTIMCIYCVFSIIKEINKLVKKEPTSVEGI
jgi:C4-dicarboxylate transporter DctQ subunit